MFISRDPIGLMGGDNVFAYAPNPTGWVDPLGLKDGILWRRFPCPYSEVEDVPTDHPNMLYGTALVVAVISGGVGLVVIGLTAVAGGNGRGWFGGKILGKGGEIIGDKLFE